MEKLNLIWLVVKKCLNREHIIIWLHLMIRNSDVDVRMLSIINEYKSEFMYVIATEMIDENPDERLQQRKAIYRRSCDEVQDIHVIALLGYENEEFVENVLQRLRSRSATESERSYIISDNRSWVRFQFIVELDNLNRKEKRKVRVLGLGIAPRLWRTTQFFRRAKLYRFESMTKWILRKHIKHLLKKYLISIGLIKAFREDIYALYHDD